MQWKEVNDPWRVLRYERETSVPGVTIGKEVHHGVESDVRIVTLSRHIGKVSTVMITSCYGDEEADQVAIKLGRMADAAEREVQ